MRLVIRKELPVLAGLAKRLKDLTFAMEVIGQYMLGSIHKNFEVGGRPKRWQRLSEATLKAQFLYGPAGRRKGRRIKTKQRGLSRQWLRFKGGKKILIHTGRLLQSITYEALKDKVEIGSNLPYAAIHQFGGWAGRGRKVYIPARPYLVVQEEDIDWIKEFLAKELLQ